MIRMIKKRDAGSKELSKTTQKNQNRSGDGSNLKVFQKEVWEYYHANARPMPWRETCDPYKILVSEVMLQQTQVPRVMIKYQEFIEAFPTINELANAPLAHVFAIWKGLGYNRRAKFLKQAAETIVKDYKGTFPTTHEELVKLPGIGPATAAAVLTYAYNKPIPFIETNIRAVYIHHFFKDEHDIADKQIEQLVAQTIDKKNPREWNWALMDYGTYLKKQHKNPATKSKHHVKQSKFEGSRRQKRGRILGHLLEYGGATRSQLREVTGADPHLLDDIIKQLLDEGMLIQENKRYLLPS